MTRVSCLLASVLVLSSGCHRPLEYMVATHKPEPAIGSQVAGSLGILGIVDGRAEGVSLEWLWLIPLVPFWYSEIAAGSHERLEGGWDVLDDLTRLMGKDLLASGLFGDVYVESDDATVVLKTTLQRAQWNRYSMTYGIPLVGGFLALFGLPRSIGSVEVSIEAQLFDHKGRPLGTNTFSEEEGVTEFIFTARSTAVHECYGLCMARILSSMRRWVAKSVIGNK